MFSLSLSTKAKSIHTQNGHTRMKTCKSPCLLCQKRLDNTYSSYILCRVVYFAWWLTRKGLYFNRLTYIQSFKNVAPPPPFDKFFLFLSSEFRPAKCGNCKVITKRHKSHTRGLLCSIVVEGKKVAEKEQHELIQAVMGESPFIKKL